MIPKFQISEDYKNLMPLVEGWRDDELEQSIADYGYMHPLIVWKEKNILIDGHRRLKVYNENSDIAEQHGFPPVIRKPFADDLAVRKFMANFQDCRRSEPGPVASAIYAGYEQTDERGGDRRSEEAKNQNGQNVCFDSAENKRRVRNKQTAAGHEAITEVDPETGGAILAETVQTTKAELREVGKEKDPAKRKEKAKKTVQKIKEREAEKEKPKPKSKAKPKAKPKKEDGAHGLNFEKTRFQQQLEKCSDGRWRLAVDVFGPATASNPTPPKYREFKRIAVEVPYLTFESRGEKDGTEFKVTVNEEDKSLALKVYTLLRELRDLYKNGSSQLHNFLAASRLTNELFQVVRKAIGK